MAIFGRNEKIGVMPQNIQNRILSILQGHGTTDNGFYEKYNLIDKALYNLNLECQMEYRFPFTDAVFTLTRKIVNENGEKYGGIYITLTVGEKEYEFARDKSANLYGESLKFEQILRDNKLSFAPQVKQEFIDELVKAKPNDYLTFNGRFGLACTSRNGDVTTFRKMFEGDLASLKKDDFMSSAKFTVDKNSPSLDAQYIYGIAYNWRTHETEMHVNINSSDNGLVKVQDIEASTDKLSEVNIGPIKLRVLCENDECRWYDSDGVQIDRDIVARMFAWAKNSTLQTEIAECTGSFSECLLPVGVYTNEDRNYLVEVTRYINEGNFEEAAKKAAEYARLTKEFRVITISGLMEGGSGYETASFAFGKNVGDIYQIKYEDDQLFGFPKETVKIDTQTFYDYCKKKLSDKNIVFSVGENQQMYGEHGDNRRVNVNYDYVDEKTLMLLESYEESGASEDLLREYVEEDIGDDD